MARPPRFRVIGRTRQARVRPSPSRFRGGLSAWTRFSHAAGGGVLLTVNAERSVYHRRARPPSLVAERRRRSAGALEGDAKAALGSILDLGSVPLQRHDGSAEVEARGVRGAEDELAGLAE